MVVVEHCPGCCSRPRKHAYTLSASESWRRWNLPSRVLHDLALGGQYKSLDECSGQEIALGDYGDSSDGNFKRHGNIFDDMRQLGIDLTDSVYHPVASSVSGYGRVPPPLQTQHDVAVTPSLDKYMVLHHPKGLSLPSNEEFELLLKTVLSLRLAEKCIVRTVIQCSESYKVERDGRRVGMEAPEGDNRPAGSGTFTPLCIIEEPPARRKEPACPRRVQQFKKIREHFCTVANLKYIAGTGGHHESAVRWATA
ncbi:hypothetical protein EDD16DRAFT_120615 [Pisolithus croceorrhizus]|nr:hypothetical protein EDD16DRAFT_120615 [Pisolithus croceorrhizus]